MPDERATVSVVIPARNAATTLPVQLEALARQRVDTPWEIVVVDNGSDDGTGALLADWEHRCEQLVAISEPVQGANRARNTGIAAASGDRILLCDADDVVDQGWIAEMSRKLDEYALVAGRLEYSHLNSQAARARGRIELLSTGLHTIWSHPWAPSCNLGFRRSVFDALGGFDPDFVQGGGDDIDFCIRANAAGFELGYAPDGVVHYRFRAESRPNARQLYWYSRGTEHLFAKQRALGNLEAFPSRCRWNQSAYRAYRMLVELPDLWSDAHRDRYVGRAAKFAGGVTGLWRYQVQPTPLAAAASSAFARAAVWIAPNGLMARRRTRQRAQNERDRAARYAAANAAMAIAPEPVRDFDALCQLAVEAGADGELMEIGSITAESLDFILEHLDGGPGLHIGNYAGLSLAYLAAHTDDVIVAVDPNVEHWGLPNPQDVVVKLLHAAGVEDRVLLVCGYTLDRNPSNDGSVIAGYDPSVEFTHEVAPVQVLPILESFAMNFGWVVLDGNHDPAYLKAELDHLAPLIREGGLAFLDDCDPFWPEIRAVFEDAHGEWTAVDKNHRIGVLRRT